MRRMARVAPLSAHVDAWVTSLHGHWVRVWLTPLQVRSPAAADRHGAPTLVLLRALTASVLALALLLLHKTTPVVPHLQSLDEALAVVVTVFVILLAARVAAAIQRWRLGNSDFHALVHAARSIVLLACSFLSGGLNVDADARFLSDLKRFAVAYVVFAVDDCSQQQRSTAADQLRDLLTVEERATLQATTCHDGNKAFAGVVELWLRCRVSRAGFTKASESLLLPHTVQVMELQHVISSLPPLYDNMLMAWKDPPGWGYWTQHARFGILGYLFFYTLVRIPTMELSVVLWVFVWGSLLFGLDSLAHSIENHHFTDDGSLHTQLLHMQHELNACLHAFFCPCNGLESLQRHDRSLVDDQHPHESSQDADHPTSRSPLSSPGVPPPDGPTKPSLKQVLDLITADSTTVSSPSAMAIEAAIREGERQPLLGSAPVSRRTGLFLQYNTQRVDEEASDATDEDEEDTDSPA